MKRKAQFVTHYASALADLVVQLQQGSVIAGDSDTVPGLLAPLTQKGFESLNIIKSRFEKPYLVLIGSQDKLAQFVQFPLDPLVEKLVKKCWPGPLTIIFAAKLELPDFIKSPQKTIGIRMPLHQGLLKLLTHFDGLFSTSANISGSPMPQDCFGIDPSIVEQVSSVVHDRTQNSLPSTIIDCTTKPFVILREGAYSTQDLEKIIGDSLKKSINKGR